MKTKWWWSSADPNAAWLFSLIWDHPRPLDHNDDAEEGDVDGGDENIDADNDGSLYASGVF